MKLMKLINATPYMLFVGGLCLVFFSCITFFFGFLLLHISWLVLVAIPLLSVIFGCVAAMFSLENRGLKMSATMGEFNEAIKSQTREP
jgi:hypothetical protein